MKIKYSKVSFADQTEPMYDMSAEHFMSMVRAQVSDDFIRNRLIHLMQTGKPVRLLGNQFVPLLGDPIEMVTINENHQTCVPSGEPE